MAAGPLSIGPGEVHAWHVRLDAVEAGLPDLARLLGEDERARAARYRFEKDRAEYTLTRGILRRLLESYGVAAAGEVRFAYGPRGKPELAAGHGPDPIRFNVSHSHGAAVVALTRVRPVGVDVERVRDTKDADGLVARFFAEEERAEYRSLPPGDRLRAFFRGWTRKEAFIKATGEGLGTPLDSFAVSLGPDVPPRLLRIDADPAGVAGWTIVDLSADSTHIVALAIQSANVRILNRRWPEDAAGR